MLLWCKYVHYIRCVLILYFKEILWSGEQTTGDASNGFKMMFVANEVVEKTKALDKLHQFGVFF